MLLTSGGNLKFKGNKIFWSNFVIDVPSEKFRYLLLGDTETRFISVHPSTGALRVAYHQEDYFTLNFDDWGLPPTRAAWTDDPHLRGFKRTFTAAMNIANSLDRRVALEVGCSLPIKNSITEKRLPTLCSGAFIYLES